MRHAASHSARGVTLPELLVVLAILALTLVASVAAFGSLLAPVRRGAELVESLLLQARARAMVTTSAQRVHPADAGTLVVEHAASCASETWTPEPELGVDLPRGVRLAEIDWSVCFDSRGIASDNIELTVTDGERRSHLEILAGGAVRWIP